MFTIIGTLRRTPGTFIALVFALAVPFWLVGAFAGRFWRPGDGRGSTAAGPSPSAPPTEWGRSCATQARKTAPRPLRLLHVSPLKRARRKNVAGKAAAIQAALRAEHLGGGGRRIRRLCPGTHPADFPKDRSNVATRIV
ncbi:hypothetical protein [Nonomuraea turcica]|uniref:hypothetical protein n=1 Tax=Nonomuraea sp. G32 TaxID=3067274 RepID=UPI00273CA8A6|nr:hypothetical protein [Nonomuraea sp. G32]MDP4502643.1 hypothetical protein [Nonomuraea sp. G32]